MPQIGGTGQAQECTHLCKALRTLDKKAIPAVEFVLRIQAGLWSIAKWQHELVLCQKVRQIQVLHEGGQSQVQRLCRGGASDREITLHIIRQAHLSQGQKS